MRSLQSERLEAFRAGEAFSGQTTVFIIFRQPLRLFTPAIAKLALHQGGAIHHGPVGPCGTREAEVLFWMTQGKSSLEIAIILNAVNSTVKKHVQNIFQKQGVENRTVAALQALEVIGLPDAGN